MMRRAGWVLAIGVMIMCGVYTAVYVYRWEWNRALLVATLFVAAEVAVATLVVLARSGARPAVEDRRVRERLAEHRPRRDHFEWLEEQTTGLSVFVTLLLGAGAILTVGAWVVDKVATRTALPTLERSLARRLAPLGFPDEPLVPDDDELLAQAGPYGVEHLESLLGPRR